MDPYVYPNTNVLKNKANIQDKAKLNVFERDKSHSRIKELRQNPNIIQGNQDYAHLCKIHQYIFQDVYAFAGKERTINMGKSERLLNDTSVAYAPVGNIHGYSEKYLEKLNGIDFSKDKKKAFEEYAQTITEVWVAHPFREGNTRTICVFMEQNLAKKGVDTDLVNIDIKNKIRDAFVMAYGGSTQVLDQALKDAHRVKLNQSNNLTIEAKKSLVDEVNSQLKNAKKQTLKEYTQIKESAMKKLKDNNISINEFNKIKNELNRTIKR